jgi:hypothetical protein
MTSLHSIVDLATKAFIMCSSTSIRSPECIHSAIISLYFDNIVSDMSGTWGDDSSSDGSDNGYASRDGSSDGLGGPDRGDIHAMAGAPLNVLLGHDDNAVVTGRHLYEAATSGDAHLGSRCISAGDCTMHNYVTDMGAAMPYCCVTTSAYMVPLHVMSMVPGHSTVRVAVLDTGTTKHLTLCMVRYLIT